jgi:hypothetical protein
MFQRRRIVIKIYWQWSDLIEYTISESPARMKLNMNRDAMTVNETRRQLRRPAPVSRRNGGVEEGGSISDITAGNNDPILSVRPRIKKILMPTEPEVGHSSGAQGECLAPVAGHSTLRPSVKLSALSSHCFDVISNIASGDRSGDFSIAPVRSGDFSTASVRSGDFSTAPVSGVEEMKKRIARLEIELDVQKRLLYLESSVKISGEQMTKSNRGRF